MQILKKIIEIIKNDFKHLFFSIMDRKLLCKKVVRKHH